jgi:hypothetical protein
LPTLQLFAPSLGLLFIKQDTARMSLSEQYWA